MSSQIFLDDLIFYQRLLACMGLYKDTIDGVWGPNTDRADKDFEAGYRQLRTKFGELDSRSEGNIVSMNLKAQALVRRFMKDLSDAGFDRTVKILSGTRTYAEQNKLFAKGRFGNPGSKVTNARGGSSNHNFGIAWDIGLFDGGKYLTGATKAEIGWYEKAAEVANLNGLDWGGNWKKFRDVPHYEVATGLSISKKRELFEQGKLVV